MTGWKMWEHGVVDSRLIVIKQVEDLIQPNGKHKARYLCKCNCGSNKDIITTSSNIKYGLIKSCGCLRAEINAQMHKKENTYTLYKDYGILLTSNTNEYVYFDIQDSEKILQHTWHKDSNGYAATSINRKPVRMHAFLGYKHPDHHDRNKLNNRRDNLISCTSQENNRNKSIQSNNTSGVVGVGWNKQCQNWEAYIAINGEKLHLGRYTDKNNAILARLKAEKKYFGEFAPQRHLFDQYNIE